MFANNISTIFAGCYRILCMPGKLCMTSHCCYCCCCFWYSLWFFRYYSNNLFVFAYVYQIIVLFCYVCICVCLYEAEMDRESVFLFFFCCFQMYKLQGKCFVKKTKVGWEKTKKNRKLSINLKSY